MAAHDRIHEFLAHARGSAAAAKVVSLEQLRAQRGDAAGEPAWGLAALRGRLVELSARGATATLTAAFELVLEAQQAGEPVAWVATAADTFFPPDVADTGVDLGALIVVRTGGVAAAARAAARLLRSGAFGLVLIDLGSAAGLDTGSALAGEPALPMAVQGRLVTLAQSHDAAVVCLTSKAEDAPSLGSLVSLRAEALRMHASGSGGSGGSGGPGGPGGGFDITVRALKDKRRGPGWIRAGKARGPSGL